MLTQPFDYLRFIFIILLAGDLPVLFGRQVFLRGDIILGGLFPVHEAGLNGSECGVLKAAQGVQRLQAMIYALDLVNNDETILPGIVLGAQILDTCSVDSYALEQTLVFIKTIMSQTDEIYCSDGSKPIYQHHPVAAVIGAASSQVSVMVASMLQLFKVPQISYSSTGTELSEKPRFAYFSRVVPPDNLQATAMAHVVSALGWTYVHAIAITGSYGERGIDSFRAAAAELGVCIDGDVHKINRRWTDIQFKELFFKMKYTKKARGVVMFVDEDQLRRMLSSLDDIRREDSTFDNYFWWIASDSWGIKQSVITGYETMISGAVTISPDLKVVPDFDRYFKKLWPSNTFLREYWELINCTDEHTNFEKCFDKHGITFKQEAYVPFVIDAVNVVARALHQYIQTTCSSLNFRNCNVSKIDFDGARLQSYYRNVSIAPGVPPHIDANGDGIGNYNIYQLNDVGHYQNVGKWTAGKKLDLNVRRVRKGLKRWDGLLPLSVCSTDCPRGYYRAYQDQNCCWTCIPCDVSTSVIINETSCVQCPLGYAPNEDLVACNLISPTTLEYNSPWVVLPAICSTLGIAATLFVIAVFVRYSNTPVIMASGRELCYFMLGGILLCYLVTFVLVSKPNVAICAASRILIGLSMSAIYAAILTKTNLLARIFLMQSVGRLDCIVPSAQIAICFGIVSIQLIGSLVWLVIDPPGTDVLFPSRKETILTCKARASHLLISLLYNMFLIIACTLYAFKTRKIPENFNETRLIGFTMYSTSILWLSFGPIYFATQNNFKSMFQSTSSSICKNPPGREVKFSWKGDSSCQAVLCVTPSETLALVLSHDVVVEITLHKHIRICHIGGVAATICNGGRVAAVHHPSIEILQQETQVLFNMVQGPRVRATSDTVHVLGVEGTDPSTQVYSITKHEVVAHENLCVATDKFCLRRDIDGTVALFLDDVGSGDVPGVYDDRHERCMLAARQAVVDQKDDQLTAIVQGVKIQITSLCMCISMSGTVALCCFFVPKVYIAVCQPYKNVRMRQSAVGRLVNQQMRFISQIATTTAPNNSTLSTSVIDCSSYPHFASCNIVEAEKNSIISSQTTKQYGTASLAVIKKSSDKCSVNSDKNDNTCRINNAGSHENSPLMKTTLFLHQSSDDELAKETIMYQNNAELFFEQLFVNYDVTFL